MLNDSIFFLVACLTQSVYSIAEQAVVRQSCNTQQCVCGSVAKCWATPSQNSTDYRPKYIVSVVDVKGYPPDLKSEVNAVVKPAIFIARRGWTLLTARDRSSNLSLLLEHLVRSG